jgi:hypothetical protein
VQVVVQRTPGVAFSGQYNTVGGSSRAVEREHGRDRDLHVHARTGPDARDPSASRTFAAQMSGNGTAHPTAGDTWTVTYTSGGTTSTLSGTF